MKYASIGSISSGTLRTADLLDTFASELDSLLKLQPRSFKRATYRKLINEANKALTAEEEPQFAGQLLTELQEALHQFAPPHCYFGPAEGDGAAYGFWPCDLAEIEDVLRVSDTSEVPRTYRGEVLHVNDHGNATLYVSNGRGKLREIWSIV